MAPLINRLFLVFLLLAVPIQMSWGAAGSYCQHESGDAAQHFGHHDHRHHPLPADSKDEGKSPLQPHADCAACHLNCPTAISASSVSVTLPSGFIVADPPRPLSPMFPERPERPKWTPAA